MDPFTIAAALSSVGHLLNGISSFTGAGRAHQAAVQASKQALDESGVKAQLALGEGDQVAAQAATQAAANGGGFTGSALGQISQLSQRALYNARNAIYGGETEANRDIYQGRVARANGNLALVSQTIEAGASLMGGMQQSAASQQYMNALRAGRGDLGLPMGPY